MRRFFEMFSGIWLTVICGAIALICLIIGVFMARAQVKEEIAVTFDYTARQDIAFNVYYFENDVWYVNPVPRDLHFLMSFTDYIEFRSNFNLNFSEEVEVYYTYESNMRLVVTYMGSIGASTNPPLFVEHHDLSWIHGRETTDRLRINGDRDGNYGVYQVDPRPFIETYVYVMARQREQMAREGLIARGFRGMSAELWIDFTYTFDVPEHEIRESITRGYRLLLTGEVFSPVTTGASSTFSDSVVILEIVDGVEFSVRAIIVLVAVFVISTAGLIRSIIIVQADPNLERRRAKKILKKYAGEIVISAHPLELEQYIRTPVFEFEELIKLAINLNKHIMCYRGYRMVMFAVIVEAYAYTYAIEFFPEGVRGEPDPDDEDGRFDDSNFSDFPLEELTEHEKEE
ncbi:MAG: DUF5305 domain-containing protein [Defluviitaleaceae bacterium]|nr:DUF5305 domain-containing protein [Defluviitaleaceae bacterium]